MKFLLLFALFFLASTHPVSAKQRTCDYVDKPELQVNINLDIPEATYDFTRTTKEMTDDHFENTVEWLQKQGVKSVGTASHAAKNYRIRGITSGGYAYSMSYSMRAKHVDRYGVYYCPYLTHVNIDFIYSSQIFIAREIPKGSCEFTETMKHEWKHHTANIIAIKKYSDRLKKDLPVIAREIELRHGYVDRSKVERVFEDIKLSVGDMIEVYYDSIWKDNRRRNDAIDTPEEYARVDHVIDLCEKKKGQSAQGE